MNDNKEIWLPVPGYSLYEVSNYGRIRSNNPKTHKNPIIMRQYPDKDGHLKIRLYLNGSVKNFFVHRIVASAFIPNPQQLPVVNHKDENPANNHVDNLEWCTVQENTIYNNMPDRRADALRRPIVQMDMSGTVIRVWSGQAQIQAETGFCGSNICGVCKGKRKSANGFKWAYA